ncbi:hypothetical protein DFP73DRAFT_583688 [Morchella snyderi]|nr:hypothetical protein DFP73DRAFT_583688 [Morchella snyderi]
MNDTQPSAQRGDKVCRPADWIDVVKFFAFNFALHALTVLPLPGANILESTVTSICAILMPTSGSGRAGTVFARLVFLWGGSELQWALNAGALCTLVPAGSALTSERAEYQVSSSRGLVQATAVGKRSVPAGFDAEQLEQVNPLTTKVHGQYPADIRWLYTQGEKPIRAENGAARLEYTLVAVPLTFSAVPLLATHGKRASLLQKLWDKVRWSQDKARRRSGASGGGAMPVAISCNYSILKNIAAIAQILYGSYELYMVSDGQIRQYGYAAYQFTVIPYVGMSILNLLAALSAPSYPARYIVHYRGLDELPPGSTKKHATSGDTAERGKQALVLERPVDDIRPDTPNVAVPMRPLEEEEEAERRARERYPQNWWNEEERAAVERMVGGAVGYVYGDFKDSGIQRLQGSGITSTVCVGVLLIYTIILLAFAILAAPYVVMQVLTGFGNGESTVLQRVFIMAWISCGQLGGVFSAFIPHHTKCGAAIRRLLKRSPVVAAFVIVGMAAVALFPPLAGFYTVATLILNDRTCSRV